MFNSDLSFSCIPSTALIVKEDEEMQFNTWRKTDETNLIEVLKEWIPKEKCEEYPWASHISKLKLCEGLFRNSSTFSMEKATIIFQQHFESLKKMGFDVNAELTGEGCTPLGWAVLSKSPALLAALINSGAPVCVAKNSKVSVTTTPLHWVCWGHGKESLIVECVEILIKNGCDPNTRELEINSQDKLQKLIPLWYAAHLDKKAVVKTLVKAKADINFETNHVDGDSTALQTAAFSCRYLSTVQTLVELGADLFAVNSKKQTAAAIARDKKHIEIANFLDKAMAALKGSEEEQKHSGSLETKDTLAEEEIWV